MSDRFLLMQQNKYIAFISRKIVHRMCPNLLFRRLLGAQVNPLGTAVYTLTFDCDFEKDIAALPHILDLLKVHGFKAGFAIIGKFVEKYPDIHKRIVAEGHEIINHSYTHPDNPHWAPDRYFNKIGYDNQKEEIERAHEVFNRILGIDCIGFRTPHYGNLHTDSVYDILAELGYQYSSSTAACAFPGYGIPVKYRKGIYEIPTGCSLNFPLAIFDSWNMLRKNNPFLSNDGAFIDEFKKTISFLSGSSKYINHYFDPYDVIENNKIEEMLEVLSSVKLVLYRDVLAMIEKIEYPSKLMD